MVSTMLEARNLSYEYVPGVPVLREVSLKLEPGESLYLLGRNGGGKTTLLTCLAGLYQPTEGQVLLNGQDIHAYPPAERARRVGLIPQIHTPAFAYTVGEMVLMGRAPHLGLFGTPTRADLTIADESLEMVGLTALRERPYTEVSGGERQLTLIARGLAQKCDILLMDEPSAHLDLSNQHRVLEVVDQLAQQGLSFVISSHAPNNALAYADHVLLLRQGQVMAYGPPAETLTETLLSSVYGMRTEVIYEQDGETPIPRAVLPRRPLTLSPESLGEPGSALSEIFKKSRHTPQLILVTGMSGAGKTTWCARLIEQARQQGLSVRGVLSPAVFEDDRKIGIDMVDLQTGERRRLAGLRDGQAGELVTPQWRFDTDAMAEADRILGEVVDGDLLIIDELGPLEFGRGEGLIEGLRLLDEGRYKVACVVVRSSLLPVAQQRWPHAQVVSGRG
jgi:ABC-type cobalamin/Fe3+-siderophores transport system ATPase subunit/nucleoside-triphosphatase THEP1